MNRTRALSWNVVGAVAVAGVCMLGIGDHALTPALAAAALAAMAWYLVSVWRLCRALAPETVAAALTVLLAQLLLPLGLLLAAAAVGKGLRQPSPAADAGR